MTSMFDVGVVGGGIVGLAAALGMAQRGFSVAVIDSGSLISSKMEFNSRVFAINDASQQLLTSVGVWSLLIEEDQLSPYRHMLVWDAANKRHIEFDARMSAKPTLGFIIKESVIRAALLQRLTSMDQVVLFPKQKIDILNANEAQIHLQSEKQQWTTRFLIAADGANSLCRTLLKIPITTWPYAQHALVATVTTELPHHQTAYQVFNPDGPLAFLPLQHAHQCSIVWSTLPVRAKDLVSVSEEVFNREITEAFAKKLGSVTLSSERHQFPLMMRHVQQYVGNHWILLGDAAHTIHPLAGLGLNLGLADLNDFLNLLDKNPGHLPLKKQLQAYQRQRKHAVWQVILLMQGLKMLFANQWPAIQMLRGFGLQCCDKLPLLKRLFIEYAG